MNDSEFNLNKWQVPGHDIVLHCSNSAIEELRRYAVSVNSRPDQRGILFGTKIGSQVHVEVASALEDEWVPSGGLVPVGWYVIRAEADIRLNRDDLDFFSNRFPDPGHVALSLRLARNYGIRVGVFFREKDGSVRSQSSYQEVVIPALSLLPVLASTAAQTQPEQARQKLAFQPVRRVAPTEARPDLPLDRPVPAFAKPAGNTRPVKSERRAFFPGFALPFIAGAMVGMAALGGYWRVSRGEQVVPANVAPVAIPAASAPAAHIQATSPDAALVQLTRDLTSQTQKLQMQLDEERQHGRRLEALVQILREKGNVRATPRRDSYENQAQAQADTPVFQ